MKDREDKKMPAAKHRDGAIEIAIWQRDTDKGPVFNAERTRSYVDQDGKWKKTHVIPEKDLLKAARLDERAYESIRRLREQAQENLPQRQSRRKSRDDRGR